MFERKTPPTCPFMQKPCTNECALAMRVKNIKTGKTEYTCAYVITCHNLMIMRQFFDTMMAATNELDINEMMKDMQKNIKPKKQSYIG